MASPDAPDLPATTRDGFFGGRLVLEQPRRGHRSGTDAVLLAAAVADGFAGRVLDVGAGVGVAGLGLALRCPRATVTLLERDAATAALARGNVSANGLAERAAVVCGDLFDPAEDRLPPVDLLVTNPPFHAAGRVRASPDAGRAGAHVLAAGVSLADWLAACLALRAPRGLIVAVLPASALPEALAALAGPAGGLAALAVHPRRSEPARRVLLRAQKGSRAPFALAPPLVLHGEGAGFTPEAERLHRGEAALAW